MISGGSSSQPSADRLALLYHLTQTFNSSLDLEEVLNRVMDEVIVATRAERGFVMLRDENGVLDFRVARGIDQNTIRQPTFQVSMGVVETVAREGKPALTGDAMTDPRFSMQQSVRILGLRSVLCVPLKLKDRILGVVYVDNRVQAGVFSQDDLGLLSAISSSAAVAIENARLYQLAVEKGRLERELQMARQVQISMLPTETPKLPGWEIAAMWQPARQVAGDYYDFIQFPDHKVGLVIADVSDKGMPAALFMATTRSIVRTSLGQAGSWVEGITHANRLLCLESTDGMFVTLFFACLVPRTGEVVYVNAGHNPPIFCQAKRTSGPVQLALLGRTGMALGVDSELPYREQTLKLKSGDFILFYTDGVTDALDRTGSLYGLERLQQVLSENREASANDILTEVKKSVRSFSEQTAPFDDITMMILKRL